MRYSDQVIQMTDVHYPSPAVATSNGTAAIEGLIPAPSICGEVAGDVGPILGRWSTRFAASLAA
ncbi:hypothetical protein [Halapricum hydrolyticum]|uniref:Uncharacterized protein n=1 Tax=Halapricum hydrolyticum TaxID=2979991 RepID=A0AAE3ICR2_9EURY|nr:hypothetical protein [Halapricum hydrolyticum]MCU4718921.1 hypothetical protein [Halapricum hydrolyticum]MCU4727986.1 hypothetical protein [Halapricum hydrolyticum]